MATPTGSLRDPIAGPNYGTFQGRPQDVGLYVFWIQLGNILTYFDSLLETL